MSAFDLFDCFCCKRTGLDGGMFLTQHLIGIKDARRGVAMFWCFNEFVGGAQLTCTIIANYLATLGDLSKKTVFLQLDNCGGENKNWLVLQMLSARTMTFARCGLTSLTTR